MIYTPSEVLVKGFQAYGGLNNDHDGELTKQDVKMFKKVYGSDPTVVAIIWQDIMTSAACAPYLIKKDRGDKGFKAFLIAMHFLWAYPKNGELLAWSFGVKLRKVQGENLWKWVQIIAVLKEQKIVWPQAEYEHPTSQKYIVSVDGIDFKCWELKHPTMPYDRRQFTQKHNHGGVKYEIAIDIYRSKVVWISGPHRGGKHDKSIYVEGLLLKIPDGKKVVGKKNSVQFKSVGCGVVW